MFMHGEDISTFRFFDFNTVTVAFSPENYQPFFIFNYVPSHLCVPKQKVPVRVTN